MKKKLLALALAGMMTLSLAACGGSNNDTAGSDQSSSSSSQDANTAASPFENMETVDLAGNEFDSTVFENNTLTLVNVWNIGCTPCVEELPILEQISQDYADKGVGVMGLYYSFGEDPSEEERTEIDEILTTAGATYPQLLASADMMAFKELGKIAAFPTTFFVDSEGKIVSSVLGSGDYDKWVSRIEKALTLVEADA